VSSKDVGWQALCGLSDRPPNNPFCPKRTRTLLAPPALQVKASDTDRAALKRGLCQEFAPGPKFQFGRSATPNARLKHLVQSIAVLDRGRGSGTSPAPSAS